MSLELAETRPVAVERPMLFSGRMVRKLLSDEKNLTRRILNPQPVIDPEFKGRVVWRTKRADTAIASINDGSYLEVCPHGRPGDRIWVRESCAIGQRMDGWKPGDEKPTVWYRADDNENLMWTHENGQTNFEIPWKPSIHMPRWACRLVLEVVSVRVERLQDITEEDAKAEGVELAGRGCPDSGYSTYRGGFQVLWDKINAKRGSWEQNPYVWVVGFRRA